MINDATNRTTDAATSPIPTARDALDFAALSERLASAAPITVAFEGDHTGRILATAGIERLPRPLRRSVIRLVSLLAALIWRGKRFHNGTGVNLWISTRRPIRYGAFTHSGSPDTHEVLDYNVADNPRWLRAITGELAALGPGVILGRMQLKIRTQTVTVMYFTLKR